MVESGEALGSRLHACWQPAPPGVITCPHTTWQAVQTSGMHRCQSPVTYICSPVAILMRPSFYMPSLEKSLMHPLPSTSFPVVIAAAATAVDFANRTQGLGNARQVLHPGLLLHSQPPPCIRIQTFYLIKPLHV